MPKKKDLSLRLEAVIKTLIPQHGQNADDLVYIGIDASHYNEYVAGNYKDSMGNFGSLAGQYSVRTVELKTSDDLIAACSNPKFKALILTALSASWDCLLFPFF